ncbi:hypothetical protein PIROE2DRAFT_6477, partial [Piromyces sp. E2]
GQSIKNNIRSNNTNASAVPSIDLNLMNKMSVINNLQALNGNKVNNENQNIVNNYNMNSLTNEKLNQLLMTVALNNNVDMSKLINNADNNININAKNMNNNINSNNINENVNSNNNINNNSNNSNGINNNNNNINLNNALFSQEFLLQLLQQQQQLQQQLQLLQQQHHQLQQQQQLNENKETKRDINMMTSPKSNVNSFIHNNNININPSPSYPSNNLRVKDNTQEFYQYFSQMNDNSMSKMNPVSMPSYAMPVSSHPISTSPYTASIPTSYSLTTNMMPISPIGMSTSFNERNNDYINLGKQEFTKPPKIPSHLISSFLISSGIGNSNNNNNDMEDNLDEKRKLKASLSKGMSPMIATVAPMTMLNTNNDVMMNATLSLRENSDIPKGNLDISKKKSLSNSSSTSLSSTTTLENDKNALLSSNDSGTAMPLTESSNTIQENSSKNSSTTSSNSTLTLLPGINNDVDNEDNSDSKRGKASNVSETHKENNIESLKVNEGTSSVSTPKLINSNVESKTKEDGDLLSTENVKEGIEALNLNEHQEILSNMDNTSNLGTTPNASSLNKYISVISAAADSQKGSIMNNNDDKTTELPILRIGQPISDLSNGRLMVNNGNININGISNSFSDGFDLLNLPSYRINYLNNSTLSNNLNSFTNDGLLSVNNNHSSSSSANNNLSVNNSLSNTNDKKDLDFLSFSSSAATPSSLISNNNHLFPPSAAIPIYKNNKKLNINNSNNNSNSLLNDGSFGGFFDNNMNSFDKIIASSGSLRSDNKLLNSFSNKYNLYDNSVNSNNSIPVSTSSFSPIYNFAPSASLPININGIPIKGASNNSRTMQQQQQQHLSQISETPDLWELDMEPYFEQSSLSKDDNSWFSGSHFASSSLNNGGGNNNSFNSSLLSNNQGNIGNSIDLHNSNDNNSSSLDFQHMNYPFNLNNIKQSNLTLMNQGTSSMNSSSIPSSTMDKNLWNSLLPSLLNNNINTTNTINESISLLQKTLAASNLANNGSNNNNNNNNNENNNNNNNNNNASLSPFIGFNDISVAQSNNLQLINQINELGNSLNAQTSLLNANKSGIATNSNKLSGLNNLHPSSAAMLSSNASSKLSATLSKPINIRNPERRDFTSTSYNNRLIPNTPSSSFSSYFSTSPNSLFSMGGYSGTNIPAVPNNSFNFGANFKNNNFNLNSTTTTTTNSTTNNIESWTSNAKVLEPPLIEVPRTWYFSKDEAAKNSETIVLPKRFFKNEIPECYDNRKYEKKNKTKQNIYI